MNRQEIPVFPLGSSVPDPDSSGYEISPHEDLVFKSLDIASNDHSYIDLICTQKVSHVL